MKIESILFANAAMVDARGLLQVEGAAWRYFEAESFPATLGGCVCGVVLVESEDFGEVHTLSFSIVDEAGHVAGTAGSMVIDASEMSEQISVPRLPFVFPFVTVAQQPTLLKAIVGSNGGAPGGLDLIVRHSQPDA